MLRALDSSRPARNVGISLALVLGAGLLVWSGEHAWSQAPAADSTTLASVTLEAAAPSSSVVRVRPSDFETPVPSPPPGSVTLRLFDSPIAAGLALSQLTQAPTNTLSPSVGADVVPPAEDEDAVSEPAVSVSSSAELAFTLQPLAARYALGLRGRCAQPERDEGDNCEVALKLNGSPLARVKFSEDASLQTTLLDHSKLNPGGNRLRLEVEAESDVLLTHLTLMPISEKLELNVGTPEARPYLLSGFYADEADGNRRAAWSSELSSALALVVEPKASAYEVRLLAHAAPGIAPLAVKATLNGKPLGSRNFGQGWGYYSYEIPSGALRRGGNQLELIYPTATRRSETEPGSNDSRLLSVRLERLWLAPKRLTAPN